MGTRQEPNYTRTTHHMPLHIAVGVCVAAKLCKSPLQFGHNLLQGVLLCTITAVPTALHAFPPSSFIDTLQGDSFNWHGKGHRRGSLFVDKAFAADAAQRRSLLKTSMMLWLWQRVWPLSSRAIAEPMCKSQMLQWQQCARCKCKMPVSHDAL